MIDDVELMRLRVALRMAIAHNAPESYFIGAHQCNIDPENDTEDEVQIDGGFSLGEVIKAFLEIVGYERKE